MRPKVDPVPKTPNKKGEMQLSQIPKADATFDEANLINPAGLVPVARGVAVHVHCVGGDVSGSVGFHEGAQRGQEWSGLIFGIQGARGRRRSSSAGQCHPSGPCHPRRTST